MSTDRRARVEQLLKARGIAVTPSLPRIERIPRDGALPLSFQQERFWFLEELAPGTNAYLISGALYLDGELDVDAMRRALDDLLQRHEVLRTAVRVDDGAPHLVVSDGTLPFTLVDLTATPEGDRGAVLDERLRESARQGFDLERPPLVRAALYRIGERSHVLSLTMHHIVADGWSVGILLRELVVQYDAHLRNAPSTLEPLALQYADYAAWQRRTQTDEALARQLAYWTRQLNGVPSRLELPTDRPRPVVQTHEGASLMVRIPIELTDGLRELSRREGCTIFVTVLTAFQVLLARYTGQRDVSVGVPVANREQSALQPIIGPFVNTLVLRARFEGLPTFLDALRHTKAAALGAFAHADAPFDRVVEAVQPTRNAGSTPLFQALFTYEATPVPQLSSAALRIRVVEQVGDVAKFDLSLTLAEDEQEIRGRLGYNRALFDEPTMARLLESFHLLLRGIVRDPASPIDALPLLSDAERRTMVVEWNEPRVDSPAGHLVHARFVEHAARTPDAIALRDDTGELTYRELDERSNQLAHRLRALGAAPDRVVAVCTSRRAALVVGLVGVLKAGAAYLPIDPDTPPQRIAFMVTDARALVVVTEPALHERLGTLPTIGVEPLGECSALDEVATSRDLAYVIYTSGSTGMPKGVMVEHGAVSTYLDWAATFYRADEGSGAPVHSSIAFDLTVTSLWLPLSQGKSVDLVADEDAVAGLARCLRAGHDYSLVKLTPVHLQLLAQQLDPAELAGRARCLVVGGEALVSSMIEPWLRFAPATRIINEYGPTEATVGCVVYEVERGEKGALPIGRPTPGTQVYVLDAERGVVPRGVAGELYLGGAQLGRGYLHRPDLTAERFVPSPFGVGSRLYRTGDLVRWKSDGRLEYLGRLDHQVKIRGFRIELGEVEATLRAQRHVESVVVVARPDAAGELQIVAYVVPRGAAPSASELRAHLRTSLPEHMVPSVIVLLDQLPLSSNGKVDRKMLPAPAAQRSVHVEPRTPTEETLAAIWREVLHKDRIGAEDHFFELGGHSLMATRLVARVRKQLAVALPVRTLFEAPTLAQLAARIDSMRREVDAPIVRISRDRPLRLSHAQERLWFLDQLESNSAYSVAAALRLRGAIDVIALHRALNEIVRRHEVLRTTFVADGGRPESRIAPHLELPLVELDADAHDLHAGLRHEAQRPFDLSRGPLLRLVVFRLAPREHVALFVMHHIVSDGWSVGVFVRELSVAYEAFLRGTPPLLPELPVQYADYAVWQRSRARSIVERQLHYWRNELAELPAQLDLPTDRPRPARSRSVGREHRFALPRALTNDLHARAREENATPFMVLLAAYFAALSRWSGHLDVAVGSPIAHRPHRELEGLIGFFMNTLVLRGDLSGDPTFDELLARVKETTLDAYANADAPLEQVVQAVRPDRASGNAPLFQVMFVLQNAPVESLTLPGVEVEVEPLDLGTARYDMALFLEFRDGTFAGHLQYDTELFDDSTAARFVDSWSTLLRGAVDEPRQRLHALPILGDRELAARVRTEPSRVAPMTGHALVERWAAAAPTRTAILGSAGSVSYAELDARANRLAHELLARGLERGDHVATLLPGDSDWIVCLLAVMKAGGAFCALNPEYPAARLSELVAVLDPRFVLTRAGLQPPVGTTVVRIDDVACAAYPSESPRVDVGVRDLAYVVFTSGSTGVPKGVLVEHRGLANFVDVSATVCDLGVGDRMLQFASVSFDASISEVFMALGTGATLVLCEPEDRVGPGLLRTLERHAVTHVTLTPSLLAQLELPKGSSVRTIQSVGEALPADVAAHLTARVRLVNAYGPTEATIGSTIGIVDVNEPLTIGRPFAGTRAYVLDHALAHVPTGARGDLYVAGVHVTRGYLGRPDLTAERFLPDAFSPTPGARMYRTGDVARLRPEGRLEFLGRTDHQVKLRGFRIELGEVENTLRGHVSVRDALVLLRDGGLIAYVIADAAEGLVETLRAHCRVLLPVFALPRAIVRLDAWPLTAHLKVDRAALPPPDRDAATTQKYAAPDGALEQLIAGTWQDLLGVSRVGRHDDFFELGGHSLLATQVMSRLREALAVEVPLRLLFEAPTPQRLAESLASLRVAQTVVRRRASGDSPKLSFAQERLWFIEQLEPGRSAYNVPCAVRVTGALDETVFERAINEVVRRHEALRTTVVNDRGRAVPRIATLLHIPLERVDLETLPVPEAALRQLVDEEAGRAFDLERGPLVRTKSLRVSASDFVVLVTMHHIVADAWSGSILLRELAALYGAFVRGAPSPLPELPIQYADWAAWQRERRDVLDADVDYWKAQLAGCPPVSTVPPDRPRPAVQSYAGAAHELRLSPELTRALDDLARAEGATLFMTIVAAFDVLLARYAGQDDVAIGSPVANRLGRETEGIIGLFVNTVVLRTDLHGDPRFVDLLERVKQTALDAFAHQTLPFERVVEELKPERSLGHSPLFQVMLSLQIDPDKSITLPSLALRPLAYEGTTAKFDLNVLLHLDNGVLGGRVEYATDLYDAATIARLVANLVVLLEGIVADRTRRLSALPLLTEGERALVVERWNDTTIARDGELLAHELFEQTARARPDDVAVVHGDARVTYAELDRRADQLALHLQELGVDTDDRVAISLPRSVEMMVAVLAVLKAGGACVPLDPAYPHERLRFMAEESGAKVIVTRAGLRDRLPAWSAQVVDVDHLPRPTGRLIRRGAPSSLVYVIYTSGSTGRPKGVSLPHRALVNLVLSELGARPGVFRELQFASLNFDVSYQEMLGTWASGGSLHLIDEDTRLDPARLAALVDSYGIERIHVPVVVLQQLAEVSARDERTLGSLREVITAGEQLIVTGAMVRLFARLPTCRLINHYGPSESHVVTTYEQRGPAGSWPRWVPIGKPIANSTTYLLDATLQPVPAGAIGELCIGGVQVARGYLGRPELTAERFVPDPFGAPGAILYRTGDLARRRNDGELVYAGRADQQVKVRGFRVELGEVETMLSAHAAVHEVVVVVRDGGLVAYCVADEPAPTIAELRAHVRQTLPDHMVPTRFVFLRRMPLTPNGKVDRRALPEPDRLEGAQLVEPENAAQQVLVEIWQQVLRRQRVSIDDNYFEIGGHSISSVEVSVKARARGLAISVGALFRHQTIRELAAGLELAEPSRPAPVDAPFALAGVPEQELTGLLDRLRRKKKR